MIRPAQLLRLFTITRVLLRHGLDELLFHIPLFTPFRFMIYLMPWNWFRKQRESRAARLHHALEDLGPIFVKFGQMLSTRRDLLPDDIAAELTRLQDQVRPFAGEKARTIVEESLGQPLETVFRHFETDPMASASIAQVHAAELLNGHKVVVKVVRPTIRPTIQRDTELLMLLAELAERYWAESRRLHPVDVVTEYRKTILDELDLMREAANATQLRRNFEGSDVLYIPDVYWDYTSRNIMVMERIYGTPVSDLDTLRANGTNLSLLSARGVEIFFTQVFRHNFFHADMHPGNIFVSKRNPDNPQYLAVDFGIVGTLSPEDKRYLAENFYAFFNRDYQRVAQLHVESGWVPSTTRVDEFESAIRTVCEPIFQRPLKDISFGHVLLRLFQTARRFNMEVQPQLVLLQKTLLNIEGLGRQLDPELDLWKTAKPFLERWMDEQVGIRALFEGAKRNLPILMENLPEMPNMLHEVMKQSLEGQLTIQQQSQQLHEIKAELRSNQRQMLVGNAAAALLISSVLLYGLKGEELIWLSSSLFATSLLLWLALWLKGFSKST